MTIEIKNLTLRKFEGNFEDLTFSFEDGKSYFVCGGNGIGKSSLMNSLVGLHKPLIGDIFYDG